MSFICSSCHKAQPNSTPSKTVQLVLRQVRYHPNPNKFYPGFEPVRETKICPTCVVPNSITLSSIEDEIKKVFLKQPKKKIELIEDEFSDEWFNNY